MEYYFIVIKFDFPTSIVNVDHIILLYLFKTYFVDINK